jgi:hypothetical protein
MNNTQHRNRKNGTSKKSEKSPKCGFFYLITSAIIFLCIPLIIIWFIQNRTYMVPADVMLEVQIYGIIITLTAFLAGYTRQGSRFHAGAFLLLIALICAYFWSIFDGGAVSFAVQDFELHLEFQLIIYWLLAIGIIFTIPYFQMLLNPKPTTRSNGLKTNNGDTR